MAIEKDLTSFSEDEPLEVITAPKRGPGVAMTVEHFMALVEHKPHQSMLEVHDKQEGFHYRLVNNNANRIRYYKALGYTIVVDVDDANMGDTGQPDQRRIAGANELVLMKQDEEYHQMHKRALQKKARQMQRGPVESFKGKASSLGFETIDEMREVVGPLDVPLKDSKI